MPRCLCVQLCHLLIRQAPIPTGMIRYKFLRMPFERRLVSAFLDSEAPVPKDTDEASTGRQLTVGACPFRFWCTYFVVFDVCWILYTDSTIAYSLLCIWCICIMYLYNLWWWNVLVLDASMLGVMSVTQVFAFLSDCCQASCHCPLILKWHEFSVWRSKLIQTPPGFFCFMATF